MIGFESRLQAVDGVAGIELELSETGLEGITVRLAEGADEVAVLEGIRRLLVAYGTRGRTVTTASAGSPEPATQDEGSDSSEIDHEVIDMSSPEIVSGSPGDLMESDRNHARTRLASGTVVELSVEQVGEQAALVALAWGERSTRRQVPTSARAIVQAVIDCAGELVGHEPISVIGMNLSSIEGTRVLTVIVGNHGSVPRVCTVSVVEGNWPAALLMVLLDILGEKSASA